MANDRVAIWNNGLKLGRAPVNGELLIGDGSTNEFGLATLTAGPNVTITNSAGGITIASTNPGGTVTGVTASAPLTSSGGTTPDIALTTPLTVRYGGTGLATLTSNYLLAGNGTGNVNLIAPGTSGNVLTSNGTAWVSAVPNYSPALLQTIATTSGTTITSNTIPTTYRKLIIYVKALRHNGGTTLYNLLINASINDGSSWLTPVTLNPALNGSNDLYLYIDMPNYSEANMIKVGSASGSGLTNFVFSITSAISGQINKLKFSWSVGTVAFTAGSIVIYGQY